MEKDWTCSFGAIDFNKLPMPKIEEGKKTIHLYIICSKHHPKGKCGIKGCKNIRQRKQKCPKCGKVRYRRRCRKSIKKHYPPIYDPKKD